MNARLKVRALVAAMTLALGAGLAVSQAVQAQPVDGMPHHGRMMRGEPGMHADRMINRWLSGARNVTPQQREQIRQIAKTAADDLRTQREAGRALHDQMRDLLTQPNIDANAVEALRQKMLAQHDQVSRRMTQAMLDAAGVLTPEQRQQIAAKAKARREMMERHKRERRQLDAPAGQG